MEAAIRLQPWQDGSFCSAGKAIDTKMQKTRGASFEAPRAIPALVYCTVSVSEVKCCTLPEVPITSTV